MRTSLFYILIISLSSCSSEIQNESSQEANSFTIQLPTIYEQESKGILILFPMSELEDSIFERITFPDLSQVSDTAFAQIYFTGNNAAGIENEILILVCNYTSDTPTLRVDYNNNLNFSDNNTPLEFSSNFLDITIPNINHPNHTHTVRLFKPNSNEKDQTHNAIQQFITKGKPFADFYFSKRRNIRVGDIVYMEDSIRIGVMDYNVNGIYNELNSDRIIMGQYESKISGTEEASGAVVLDSSTYFQSTNYAFEITHIAKNGSSISIRPTLNVNFEKRITLGDTISDYSFELITSQNVSIHDFLDGQKFLYLNFWASWCSGCLQEINDLIQLHDNYSSDLTILSLNYNEDVSKTKQTISKYNIPWTNGLSTEIINEELFIHGLPRNILINPAGEIIEMNIHPTTLLKTITEIKNAYQ